MKIIDLKTATESDVLSLATKVLSSGGLVIYPTETCYGLGVDATSNQAVQKLLDYKGGRKNKATSIAVSSKKMAKEYVSINNTAAHIYDELLPGPITVISSSKGKVSNILESPDKTLGVRLPELPIARKLVEALGKPITATSANTSGKKQPYSLADYEKYTSTSKVNCIDLFISVGPLPKRPSSSVVDTTQDNVSVLRQGEIHFENSSKATISKNPAETLATARKHLSKYLEDKQALPIVYALQGNLGAGKTQFVKGLADALKITDNISSPTYQVMREYNYNCGKMGGKLIHIDTWRLNSLDDFSSLGIDTYLQTGNVIAIEWMEQHIDTISSWKSDATIVWIKFAGSGNEPRTITIKEDNA